MQLVTDRFQKELKQHGDYSFPLLVSYERLSRYESDSFPWHWHPEIELTLVTHGQMIYQVNRSTFHLRTGDVLFGNANTLHTACRESGEQFADRDCHYTSITFDPKLIYGFQQSIIGQKYVEPVTRDFSLAAIHFDSSQPWHREVIASVQALIRLSEQKDSCYELDIIMALQKIWRQIYLNHAHSDDSSSHERTEYNRIKEIMVYLQQHYMEKISLKDISDHIHLCESECSRLFRRYMNVSLFTFLQEYRIDRSLEFLADPSLTITDVAARTGFSDSNYYSKVFVKLKGYSPREYRRKLYSS